MSAVEIRIATAGDELGLVVALAGLFEEDPGTRDPSVADLTGARAISPGPRDHGALGGSGDGDGGLDGDRPGVAEDEGELYFCALLV